MDEHGHVRGRVSASSRIRRAWSMPRETSSARRACIRAPDSGQTWTRIATPFFAAQSEVLADRDRPGTLYVTADTIQGETEGTYKSIDGGATWASVVFNVFAKRIVQDPNGPTIYVATARTV
jgi:hypothetical protein